MACYKAVLRDALGERFGVPEVGGRLADYFVDGDGVGRVLEVETPVFDVAVEGEVADDGEGGCHF